MPDFPSEENTTHRQVPLSAEVFIERTDFLETEQAGFRRLTPGQAVGLRHAGLVLSVKSVEKVSFHVFFRIRIFNGLEEGTCTPNSHEAAFLQGNKNICWMSKDVPNAIKTEFEDFFRGSINNFGQQLVQRFDSADRKCTLAACHVGQLMTEFEAMAMEI